MSDKYNLGDLLVDPDGVIATSKSGKTFYLAEGYITKAGKTSCKGCCFAPHHRCKNEYTLCIKHCGPEYRSWIYKESER